MSLLVGRNINTLDRSALVVGPVCMLKPRNYPPLFVKDDTYRKYFSLLLWNAKLWKFRETSTEFGCWYTTWKLSRNYGNYTGTAFHTYRGWEPQSKTTGVGIYLYALYVSCSITKEESSLYLLLCATADYESSVAFKKNRQNMSLTTIMNERRLCGYMLNEQFWGWQRIVVVQ